MQIKLKKANIKVRTSRKEKTFVFEHYNDLLSVEELCEMLMIGKNSAYTLLASGEIKAYRAGTRWKIPREAVSEYVKKRAKL